MRKNTAHCTVQLARYLRTWLKVYLKVSKEILELIGVGYRAQKQGNKLVLNVGYSHPVEIEPEEGLEIEVPANTKITIKGIDKERVGALAANIRGVRPPEPYKGKGIRYEGEFVRRKEGKTGK